MKLWCRLARDATGNRLMLALRWASTPSLPQLWRKDIPIYAFEPNPLAYARLRVNKDRNRFTEYPRENGCPQRPKRRGRVSLD